MEEQENILTWLGAVKEAVKTDYDLACRTAELSIWARGYGNVRRNGQKMLTNMFAGWQSKLTESVDKVAAEVDQSLLLAHANPDSPSGHH